VKLSYVVPVHNEEAILASNVARLVARLVAVPGSEVLLVENGSRDGSWALAEGLAGSPQGVRVRAFREPAAGIGHAYHRGLSELSRDVNPAQHWAVLTAADLPFDFSDLEQALPHLQATSGPRVLIGSKAHPASRLQMNLERRLASLAYRWARRLLLGMRCGDSQGSVFIRADLAALLVPQVGSRDFFYSTELIFLAERAQEQVLEVPVVLAPAQRNSTVRPVRDGLTMGLKLARLSVASRGRRSRPNSRPPSAQS
jgi:glycosyltransferase involved in cell wall biosynthesis